MNRNETTNAERAKLAMLMIESAERHLIATMEQASRIKREPDAVVAELIDSIDAKMPTLPVRKAKPGNISMREHLAAMRAELVERPAERLKYEADFQARKLAAMRAEIASATEVLNAN